jgi:citrate synthase
MSTDGRRRMVTAAVASERLGVSLGTLYAYVSRGLIHTETPPGDARARLYSLADIEHLIWRKTKARKPANAVATALSWGLPVLETRLSAIVDGRLTYRGQDITALAENRTLEDIATLLWQVPNGVADAAAFDPSVIPGWNAVAPLFDVGMAIDRAIALMSFVRRQAHEGPGTSPPWQLVRALAATFVADPLVEQRPLHQALAIAWKRPQAADLVRRILVCCADHELNASTFAVRVVASTDVDIATCLLTGLTAICGLEHTGIIGEARRMVAEALASDDPEPVLDAWSLPSRPIPGFYHRLYPDGDPRARAILSRIELPQRLSEYVDAVRLKTGLQPNIEFAMVAAEYFADLPVGAAEAVFATGRSVGWIAHAMEQKASGVRIRPRAHTGT